jgi:probable addiction module antidote protein
MKTNKAKKINTKYSTVNHDDWLKEKLKDSVFAAEYLTASMEDLDTSQEVFLIALRQVAEVHGLANLAKRAQINRVTAYKVLNKNGNPEFKTVLKLLNGAGINMEFKAKK